MPDDPKLEGFLYSELQLQPMVNSTRSGKEARGRKGDVITFSHFLHRPWPFAYFGPGRGWRLFWKLLLAEGILKAQHQGQDGDYPQQEKSMSCESLAQVM